MENEQLLVEGYRRIRNAGVEVQRTTDHGMSHSIYLFDPEGNLLEFYADAVTDWRAFYRSKENQLISGHWDPEAAPPSAEKLYHPDPVATSVPGAALRCRRLAYASLLARDLAAMQRFYEEVAGLRLMEAFSSPSRLAFCGSTGEVALLLYQAESGSDGGLHHLSFDLWRGEDPLAAAERFERREAGVLHRQGDSGKGVVVISDPDGLQLAFRGRAGDQALGQPPARPDVRTPYIF